MEEFTLHRSNIAPWPSRGLSTKLRSWPTRQQRSKISASCLTYSSSQRFYLSFPPRQPLLTTISTKRIGGANKRRSSFRKGPDEGGYRGMMEVWRRAAGVATRRQGALEALCRCSDMEVWRSRGAATWRHGALEARGRCSRRGGIEVYSSEGALQV